MKTIRLIPRALVSLAAILFAFNASAQVFINEICADNANAFNNDGDFPDFVELYNTNTAAVNIAGWRLTRNLSLPNNPAETYIFPANTVVPGRGFLVVICDGQTNQRLHAGFNIGKKGETISLLGPSLGLRDGVRFGFQVTDRTLGRVPDGSPGTFVLCRATAGSANAQVPLGNRQRLRINEWMPSRDTQPDWFEIYNPETNSISLAGLVFSDRLNVGTGNTNKSTITNSFLAAGGYLQLFADDKANTGHDELDFKLSSGADRIIIFSQNRSNMFHTVFWPDPTGKQGQTTAAQLFISYGWLPDGNTNDLVVTFPLDRDTPGDSNFLPIDNVLINEIMAHTDPPLEDAIELYNPTAQTVDISGWWLSDNKDDYNKFRIPNGTILQPNGYIVFYEKVGVPGGFNPNGQGIFPSFSLSSSQGDDVYLFATDATGKLTGHRRGVDFPASANGTSYGRYVNSNGESDFIPLEDISFGTSVRASDPTNRLDEFRTGAGAPNAGPMLGPLVLNEVMYHPPDIISGTNIFDNELDEYVEIYNISTNTVYLYDTNVYPYPPFGAVRTNTWHLRGEIEYDFPTNVSLGPGRSLIVVNFALTPVPSVQSNTFANKYSVPPTVQLFGAYRGKLANGSGTVQIERPDPPQPPNRPDAGFVPYIRVDKVRYDDDPPWPVEPDGMRIFPSQVNSLGYVLSRKKPERYGGDVTNWVAAVPSAGRQIISNSVSRVGNITTVRFEGLAGSGYTVQHRDALEAGTWQKLRDVQPETTSGPRSVTDNGNGSKRFYRVLTPIQP